MVDYPAELTPALEHVLGMNPGEIIQVVGAMRACGWVIRQRYEQENAAVRHFLIPLVIQHGEDWREAALDIMSRRGLRAKLEAMMVDPEHIDEVVEAFCGAAKANRLALSALLKDLTPVDSTDPAARATLARLYGLEVREGETLEEWRERFQTAIAQQCVAAADGQDRADV